MRRTIGCVHPDNPPPLRRRNRRNWRARDTGFEVGPAQGASGTFRKKMTEKITVEILVFSTFDVF